MNCHQIYSNITEDCNLPIIGGIRKKAWVLNSSDVLGYSTEINTMIVTGFNLKPAKIIYTIDGLEKSVKANYNFDAAKNLWNHFVNLKGFDISPISKQNIEGAKNGDFILITENVDKTFEIFGIDTGLKMEVARDPNDDVTGGAFDLTFKNVVNLEPRGARNLFVNNYTTTLAYLDYLQNVSDFSFDFNNDF